MSEPGPTVNITLRLGTPGDLATLVALDDDAGRLYANVGIDLTLPDNHPFTLAERNDWLRSLEHGWTFLACDDSGQAIGFAALEMLDGAPYLDQLSVAVHSMQKGVGRKLLHQAFAWAREHGEALWLTTYAHVPWNRPFYEREGFTTVVPDCGPTLAQRLADQRGCLPFPEHRIAMRKPL